MNRMTALDYKIQEMAGRIRELREIEGLTPEQMAQKTDVTVEEYLNCENGKSDLNFAFIYRCAQRLGVDISQLVTGESPKLSFYTLTRNHGGMPIRRRAGCTWRCRAA